MKRWFAAVLAALLLLGCAALAEAEGREAFVGIWELDSLELNGEHVRAEQLSFGVTVSIRADDTMVFALAEEEFLLEQVSYRQDGDGWVCTSTLAAMSPMRVDGDGLLYYTLTNDGSVMSVWMRPAQPAGDPVTGLWTIDHAYQDGEYQARTTLRDITMTIEADQYGVLNVNGKRVDVRLFLREGEPVLLRADGYVYPSRLLEDGMLSFDLVTTQGSAWTLVMRREEQAGEAAAAPAENPFVGSWNALTSTYGGYEVALKTVGLQRVQLVFTDSRAELVIDGSRISCEVTWQYGADGQIEGCTVRDGSEIGLECTIDGQGRLQAAMNGSSGTVTLVMERMEPEASAGEENTQTVEPQGYDGLWTLTHVRLNGAELPAAEMGMGGTLRITGETARYTVGDENALGVVTLTQEGLTVTSRSGEYRFVLDDAGQLCQESTSFGLRLTMCFTREVE